jgi:hypothetical protein
VPCSTRLRDNKDDKAFSAGVVTDMLFPIRNDSPPFGNRYGGSGRGPAFTLASPSLTQATCHFTAEA